MTGRLRAALCAGLIAVTTGWVTAGTAGAAAAPTVTAPNTVAYFATVVITGTTPLPNERVQLFFHSPSTTGYVLRRDLHSDATGHYRTVYSATTAMSFYAHAGSVNSTIHLTRLVTAMCTVSGPAFRTLPIADQYHDKSFPDFAAFTATRNGLWAGVNADTVSARIAVIAWRPGQTRARVLARFDYLNSFVQFGSPGSVDVVGIGPSGNVVASVQHRGPGYGGFSGYVWVNGVQKRLVALRGWVSERPTSVAADGSIIGQALAGPSTSRTALVVRWSGDGSRVTVLENTGRGGALPYADGNGDVTFSPTTTHVKVRRVSGAVATLPELPAGAYTTVLAAGAGDAFYGYTDAGMARWAVPKASGPIAVSLLAPRDGNHWIMASGPRGDVVDGSRVYASAVHLRTARGAYVTVPDLLAADNHRAAGYAIDEYGRVAFTSARDHLVHILTCR